jgi:hypothetical protein
MQPRLRLVLLACFVAFALDGGAVSAQLPTKQKVIDLLRGNDFDGYQELVNMGAKAFPIYEEILTDPNADDGDVGRVLLVIGNVKTDRRRFIKRAVSRLTDRDFGVRLNAVLLLKDIGSPAETSPVVALLSDKRVEIIYAAAKTLAAIGGPNEVVAMEVWLRGASDRDDPKLLRHVRKCRDALKKRLEEPRAKDPSK